MLLSADRHIKYQDFNLPPVVELKQYVDQFISWTKMQNFQIYLKLKKKKVSKIHRFQVLVYENNSINNLLFCRPTENENND